MRCRFEREVCQDFSNTQLMLLFLLGELCLVALKDRKEYHKCMVKRKPQQVWTYDTIGPNSPSTVDWFYALPNAQNWGRAEMLAVEVFWGRLGIATLPLDMTERLMVGTTFIWMYGEREEVV